MGSYLQIACPCELLTFDLVSSPSFRVETSSDKACAWVNTALPRDDAQVQLRLLALFRIIHWHLNNLVRHHTLQHDSTPAPQPTLSEFQCEPVVPAPLGVVVCDGRGGRPVPREVVRLAVEMMVRDGERLCTNQVKLHMDGRHAGSATLLQAVAIASLLGVEQVGVLQGNLYPLMRSHAVDDVTPRKAHRFSDLPCKA